MTKTIALARHAPRNPAQVVLVGGGVFAEDSEAGARVGADSARNLAIRTSQMIQVKLKKRR